MLGYAVVVWVEPPVNLSDKALERYFGEILDNGTWTLLKNMMKKLMNIMMKIVQMVAGGGNNNLKTKTESMVLKKGSTGPEVEELQKILGIKVDGDFGPDTKLAVMKYQAQNGLTADGIVGPKTWSKMKSTKRYGLVDQTTYGYWITDMEVS